MIRVLSLVAAGWCALLLTLSADAAPNERRIALVVGNSAYQHAGYLPDPVNDAAAVAALLKKAGFEVSTVAMTLPISSSNERCANSRTRPAPLTSLSCTTPVTASR